MKLRVLERRQLVWPDGRGGNGECWLDVGDHRFNLEEAHWVLANYGGDRKVLVPTIAEAEPGDSVAVIRDMGLGDILMTTPTVRAMHEFGLRVHYWTLARYLPLLRGNPCVESVHDLGTATASPDTGDCDIVLNWCKSVERDPRYDSVPRVNLFASAACQELNGRPPTPEYYATRSEWQTADSMWNTKAPKVVLVARASDYRRNWPYMRELSERLAAEGIVCGVLDQDPTACWERDGVHNFGGVGMRESIALIGTADAVVSHDTGLLYCGPATGTPTIGIFGCWQPRLRLEGMPGVFTFDANEILGRGYCYDHIGCDGRQLEAVTVEAVQAKVKEMMAT